MCRQVCRAEGGKGFGTAKAPKPNPKKKGKALVVDNKEVLLPLQACHDWYVCASTPCLGSKQHLTLNPPWTVFKLHCLALAFWLQVRSISQTLSSKLVKLCAAAKYTFLHKAFAALEGFYQGKGCFASSDAIDAQEFCPWQTWRNSWLWARSRMPNAWAVKRLKAQLSVWDWFCKMINMMSTYAGCTEGCQAGRRLQEQPNRSKRGCPRQDWLCKGMHYASCTLSTPQSCIVLFLLLTVKCSSCPLWACSVS